jgi:hypothetical protein
MLIIMLIISSIANRFSILYSGLISIPFVILSLYLNKFSFKPTIKNGKNNFNLWILKYILLGFVRYVIIFIPLLIWIILNNFNYTEIFDIFGLISVIVLFPLMNIADNYLKMIKKND